MQRMRTEVYIRNPALNEESSSIWPKDKATEQLIRESAHIAVWLNTGLF